MTSLCSQYFQLHEQDPLFRKLISFLLEKVKFLHGLIRSTRCRVDVSLDVSPDSSTPGPETKFCGDKSSCISRAQLLSILEPVTVDVVLVVYRKPNTTASVLSLLCLVTEDLWSLQAPEDHSMVRYLSWRSNVFWVMDWCA